MIDWEGEWVFLCYIFCISMNIPYFIFARSNLINLEQKLEIHLIPPVYCFIPTTPFVEFHRP